MIHTIIAEPIALIRAGLVACLASVEDIEVLAELSHGDDVLPTSQALHPDVAVLAAALPGQDGFVVAGALHEELPSCHSLIMSARRNPRDVRLAAAAHAAGLVVRDAAAEFITEAIRLVAKGTKVVDPDLAFAALSMADNPLTPREVDALRLASQGATSSEIAKYLCLSVGTVRNYLSRAIAKTDARNRVDAIRIAEGSGWL